MFVSLTIIRYKKIYIPFAFIAMAIFRLPLWLNKQVRFYKLMGCGKNGTFDKVPDLQQWAVLTVRHQAGDMNASPADERSTVKLILGNFIAGWLRLFECETATFSLVPLESHGLWDRKKIFDNLVPGTAHDGRIAVLTRATIRVSKLKYFWENVAPVANKMDSAKGFLFSAGVGEVPWVKQATFSVWESKDDMKAFAYGMKEHSDVIKKTRSQDWYSEEMFTRFKIMRVTGTINGLPPLGKQVDSFM